MEESVRQRLVERQTELIKTIEAIEGVLKSKHWQNLTELVWDKEENRIQRLLLVEAQREELDTKSLYRLQGELLTIRRYNLVSYAEKLIRELEGIKIKLQ